MTSTIYSHHCDYLNSNVLQPHAFTSERAELVHIDEQISSLDNHISQLNTLHYVLYRRSCQLHLLLSPIYSLPTEVLSYIFQHLIPGHCDHPDFDRYRECLGQALVVSSVSSYFRYIAFGTPKLWRNISLYITNGEAIEQALSLLQHCIALIPSVNIFVSDTLDEDEARSAIDILLTSDVTQKVKSFELNESVQASNLWIEKLTASCFPMLDTLSITHGPMEEFTFDLGTLTTVTRLNIDVPWLNHSTIVPSSVQYLNISEIPQPVLISLLYQCPNLIECTVDEVTDLFDDDSDNDNQFTTPLTLAHLKKLASVTISAIETSASVENLRLPSLEFLQLEYSRENEFIGVILLCRNVSATLTTLIINTASIALDYDELYQLCKLPFPKLRKLEFWSSYLEPFQSAIHALGMLDGEYTNSETRHLSALRSITLRCGTNIEPHFLLDLLKEWRIGEAFYFNIQFNSHHYRDDHWSPNLREELRSIVGRRRIEVTWGGRKV